MAAPEAEYDRLLKKPPLTWSVSEVGQWLNYINLEDYKISFLENSISGAELRELNTEDLVSLGVARLGHRKRLQLEIQQLFGIALDGSSMGSAHSNQSFNSHTSASSMSNVSTSSASSARDDNKVVVKCTYKGEVQKLRVLKTCSLNRLKRKIKSEFGRHMDLKYTDEDGDRISLRKDRHLRTAIKSLGADNTLRVTCTPAKNRSAKASERELKLLDSMVDAIIMIDVEDTVVFFNRAAEKMFGYRKRDMIGKKVTKLMPKEHARNHSKYVANYLAGKGAGVMGKGRRVEAVRKNGETFSIYLSLSETNRHGEKNFVGTIQELTGRKDGDFFEGDVTGQYTMLENLLDAALVIDEKGSIQFVNSATCKMMGYQRAELLNRNVKMLMTSADAANHDGYLQTYLETGNKHVIGSGRDVVAQRNDGTLMPVHLAVTETTLGRKRIFTGILTPVDTSVPTQTRMNVLRQEREVLDNLCIPALIIDQRGVIQFINESGLDVWGYSLAEVVGRSINMMMPDKYAKEHDSYIAKFLATGQGTVFGRGRKVPIKLKSGDEIAVSLSVTKKKDEKGEYIFTGVVQIL